MTSRVNVLMFTIATNGYDTIFGSWLATQQQYAESHNYKYVAVTQSPVSGISGTNSSWLKIPIIVNALRKGYDWVFFVDADCRISPFTPPIESVCRPGKSIYACHDVSHRINGGVIIAQNEKSAIHFFSKILWMSDLPGNFLPKEDRNLYENGHLIYFGKKCNELEILPETWNNTTGTPMGEYIWHGGGRYQDKPVAHLKPLTISQAIFRRLREGPRYFLLRRLAKFYKQLYCI